MNAFIDSGVQNYHAHQLGLMLGLAEDRIQTINDGKNAGPAIFAANIVSEWLKNYPKDNIQETYSELEDKLRKVHLNCVIGRLKKREIQSLKL